MALAKAKSDAVSGNQVDAPTAAGMPKGLALGPDAKVTAAYDIVWPQEAPDELARWRRRRWKSTISAAEETNRLTRARQFYARQARDGSSGRKADMQTKDGHLWIDSIRATANDRRQSIDVIITPPADYVPAAKVKDEEEVDLVVEVLTITIKDPAKTNNVDGEQGHER